MRNKTTEAYHSGQPTINQLNDLVDRHRQVNSQRSHPCLDLVDRISN